MTARDSLPCNWRIGGLHGTTELPETTELPDLSISDEKLCFIIAKAREFDVKDVVTDAGDSSNPSDDMNRAVLEATRTIRWWRNSPRSSVP